MIQTGEEAIEWIHSTLKFGMKPGLQRMEWLMERLGNPHLKKPVVHIAGTNGKGSTVNYMRAMLEAGGYTVGTFTSPYFLHFQERISVNQTMIDDASLVALVRKIKPLAEQLGETELGFPTEFEIITTLAFLYFASREDVDVLLIEVGLGGRLDSTNIVQPILTVITTIGFDHQAILGNTIEQIAREKAGIIKKNAPLVLGNITGAAKTEIVARAREVGVRVIDNSTWSVESIESSAMGEVFYYENGAFSLQVTIPSIGVHQVENASLAITAVQELPFHVSPDQLQIGLSKAIWSGRTELVQTAPHILLDGAHNREGIEALISAVKTVYSDKPVTILLALLKDKPIQAIMTEIQTLSNARVYVTEIDVPRAASITEVLAQVSEEAMLIEPLVNWKEMLKRKLQEGNDELIVVTGSLYFIPEVKRYLLSLEKDR